MLAYRSHGVRGYSTEIRGQRSGMRWSRFVVSQVPKSEAVKCRDMVYILSPDILYSFTRRDEDLGHPPIPGSGSV